MTLTAGKALFFQNLALFIVDELFLAVRLGLRERYVHNFLWGAPGVVMRVRPGIAI